MAILFVGADPCVCPGGACYRQRGWDFSPKNIVCDVSGDIWRIKVTGCYSIHRVGCRNSAPSDGYITGDILTIALRFWCAIAHPTRLCDFGVGTSVPAPFPDKSVAPQHLPKLFTLHYSPFTQSSTLDTPYSPRYSHKWIAISSSSSLTTL